MTNRRLGSSSLEVGPIAYGCWRLTGPGSSLHRAIENVEAALDAGMTLVDTADIYGVRDDGTGFGDAEVLLGRVLVAVPSLRDRMVLATKGGIVPPLPYDSSADHLRTACEDSLRRLGVDVIDLYQVHRPDLLTHPAEVAAVLTELRESGKVRELGVSNYSPSQLAALQHHLGDVPLVSVQPELSLLHLDPIDDGTLDAAMASGLTPLAWSPLAGGRLVGDDAPAAVSDVLWELAGREGVSEAAIALAWVAGHPSAPIPIIGSQRPERIRDAAAAADVRLSRRDWYRLTAAAGRDLP